MMRSARVDADASAGLSRLAPPPRSVAPPARLNPALAGLKRRQRGWCTGRPARARPHSDKRSHAPAGRRAVLSGQAGRHFPGPDTDFSTEGTTHATTWRALCCSWTDGRGGEERSRGGRSIHQCAAATATGRSVRRYGCRRRQSRDATARGGAVEQGFDLM